MRKRAKVDANHGEIVQVLRGIGASVVSLAAVGHGVPDLCVGYRGVTYLLEVKDGAKVASRQQLTPDEVEWHDTWRGHVAIVRNADDALRVLEAI